ncbi:MAG: hypothetical protein JWR47_713 [Phenylobacterium sp.]|jgi:hypothetical protein|uniref:hypothetical protein n=1 Tax=Phenylobacterium sp. TaxID=1871053 RepID=UPI002601B18A|nr:hypothetical protein [Phenylobacterium sp.]MDB5434456.1 hypothetical protein [Phenylobacterium sp.]MDB5462425.1 hypothetical protein [Phenylobacterium sp.]MDB5499762.1 hypothetical protein [Phenylobacterium sp.]
MTADEPVATGNRRDEAHYEPDPDQLVRARFLAKPADPLPAEMATARVEAGKRAETGPPVEDVAVAPDTPSVWDARPLDRGESADDGSSGR